MPERPPDAAPDDEILSLLPYAHMRGGFPIRPDDIGKAKGIAITSMEEQVQIQLKQIYEQVDTLARQAKEIRTRAEISYKIYQCEMKFIPTPGHVYHLYEDRKGRPMLSMISPEELGPLARKHLATVRQLHDHTWEIVEAAEDFTPASE
ncbi:MAG: DUF2452 domain-containing protein [Verrucomicrobiae bacterium]|nr:DUF2452 domain-containing protein [Verrucomicrobiae bacterium]